MKLIRKNWVPRLGFLAMALAFLVSGDVAFAQADPTTILGQADAAFEAVATLVIGIVSFFVILRIVKSIRK